MSRVEVESRVNVYEVDHTEPKTLELPKLVVKSHWNYQDRVVLVIGGKSYTVVGHDLKLAIENAMHVR